MLEWVTLLGQESAIHAELRVEDSRLQFPGREMNTHHTGEGANKKGLSIDRPFS